MLIASDNIFGVPEEIRITKVDNGFTVEMRMKGKFGLSTNPSDTFLSTEKYTTMSVFENSDAPERDAVLRNLVRVLDVVGRVFEKSVPPFDNRYRISVELLDTKADD